MKASDLPDFFLKYWAKDATDPTYVMDIPEPAQSGGHASLSTGFPPDTFVPTSAGGIPPFGNEVNGVLRMISKWNQWGSAGGAVPYDATFATEIGGYPKGATVSSTTFGTLWISTADDNTTDPDSGSAANWLGYSIPGLGGGLTRITAPGSGNFSVPATVSILKRVRLWGPGGGGGAAGGGGGGGGGYVESVNMAVTPGASMAYVLGAGGAAGAAPSGNGGNGAATAFNGLSAGPGLGGHSGFAPVGTGGVAAGGNVINLPGRPGREGTVNDSLTAEFGGDGGDSPLGGWGGQGSPVTAGIAGISPGGGGTGGGVATGNTYNGGAGAAGLIVIEY